MVASVILVLTAQCVLRGPYVGDMHVIAGLIILVREFAVSGLREFLGGLQVSVPVTRLAKWKTAMQLIALGALILGRGLPGWNVMLGTIEANVPHRSEEHTSELQSLMRISYAVFCLKKKNKTQHTIAHSN